jgi:hypothetical protein
MITICAAFFMPRVCLDRQRRNPLDRKIRGLILHMVKLNAYQRRQILISFSIQTLSHTLINNLNCRSLLSWQLIELSKDNKSRIVVGQFKTETFLKATLF